MLAQDFDAMVALLWKSAAIFLILVGSFISMMNWRCFFYGVIYKLHSSWIPLFGGLCLSIGLSMLYGFHAICALPLALDWGALPGIAYSVIWWMRHYKDR